MRRGRKRGQKSVQTPIPPSSALPTSLQRCPQLPPPGSFLCRGCCQVLEELTAPASQLKRFCRWSVCPVGPVAQEKKHLIIFYFFLSLTPHHCNTREQTPGNSEAAARSRRCSESSRLTGVSLLPPGLSEPHCGEGFVPLRACSPDTTLENNGA